MQLHLSQLSTPSYRARRPERCQPWVTSLCNGPTAVAREPVQVYDGDAPQWRPQSLALRACLSVSPMARSPVSYVRACVDHYRPNETFLLPASLTKALMASGGLPDQQPAGTYMRRVLEELLIDLSWSSSHLEGNAYTRMDTEALPAADLPRFEALLARELEALASHNCARFRLRAEDTDRWVAGGRLR